MIWLTWRQSRLNAAVTGAGLLALAVALALSGPRLADTYAESSDTLLDWLTTQSVDRSLYVVGTVAGYVVPALIGMFWGAPMIARELEAGTHRLVWSQTISRNTWLATKLGLGLLGSGLAGGVLGLAMTWWAHPIDQAVNAAGPADISSVFDLPRLVPEVFAARGIVTLGYAAFAFALGALAGAVVRRTVPAMAATLVVYIVVQVAMPTWVRPHLVAPTDLSFPITQGRLHGIMGHGPDQVDRLDVALDRPGAWVLTNDTVDQHGEVVHSFPSWITHCLSRPGTEGSTSSPEMQSCFDRLAAEGIRQRILYQPASHYWALQWRETGLLLAGAGALAGACFWRVRRLS